VGKDERSVQLRKGVIELAILALLRDKPRYGGEIVDELAAHSGLESSAGTVYPLLTRLKSADFVYTTWQESPVGPPRKYYTLTTTGRTELHALADSWREMNGALAGILEDDR